MVKMFNNILKISNIPKSCRERYLNLECRESAAMNSCGIHFSGISHLRRGYMVGSPNPSESHMVIFSKGGEGYLRTRENEYALKKNSVMIVPVGHACMFAVKDDDWKILWFYMRPLFRWQVLCDRGVTLFDTDGACDLENSMEAYIAESGIEGASGTADAESNRAAALHSELICIYLDRLLKISGGSEETHVRDSLETIWKRVRDNAERKWGLEELAVQLNVSPSTFQRMVRKHYSTTAWQKVIQIRMEQARTMLLNTDYPLKVISDKLGYADEFVFSNAFKKFYGTFPRFYKMKAGSGRKASRKSESH